MEDTATSPRSLLDVLRAPQASELTRKRKIDCNPPTGKKTSRGQGSSEPKSVTPKQRVNEFPDECLTVSRGGKLFCSACREELSLRKNTVYWSHDHFITPHCEHSLSSVSHIIYFRQFFLE